MKKILYLVQAKAEIPLAYLSIRKKIVLLSYLQKTAQTDIFLPNSTWTEGRNALFNYVQKTDYDYYVFLDEDLEFEPSIFNLEAGCTQSLINEIGFKQFEDFLDVYAAPITTPRQWHYNRTSTQIAGIPLHIQRKALENESYEAQPVDWFDAAFNAYRKDVFFSNLILPYSTEFDVVSWWTSQFIVILKSNYHFKDHIIQANRIAVKNLESTTNARYRRGEASFGDAYKKFLSEHSIDDLHMTSEAKLYLPM